MSGIDPIKSNQNPEDQVTKFSPSKKEELRKLFEVHDQEFKSGKMIAAFKDGHWQAISSKDLLFKIFKDFLDRFFTKQHWEDTGIVLKEAALAPKYALRGELFIAPTELEQAGRYIGTGFYVLESVIGAFVISDAILAHIVRKLNPVPAAKTLIEVTDFGKFVPALKDCKVILSDLEHTRRVLRWLPPVIVGWTEAVVIGKQTINKIFKKTKRIINNTQENEK